jgi:hypothetical protein
VLLSLLTDDPGRQIATLEVVTEQELHLEKHVTQSVAVDQNQVG